MILAVVVLALAYVGGTLDPDDRSGSRFDLAARARYAGLGVRNKALMHAAAGCALAFALTAPHAPLWAFSVTLGAGVAWEIGQRFVRWSDLLGALLGAVVGAWLGALV